MLVYPYPAGASTPTYGGVKVNTYEKDWNFNNVGTYVFGMIDRNLDGNIQNITGSSNVAFALLDTLRSGNYTNYNNTPIATNPPIDNACSGQPFFYNPGMGLYDVDGDSIGYSIIPFKTGSTQTNPATFSNVANYTLPSNLSVDASGTLSWLNVPSSASGEYEIDMFIREYRRYGGHMVEMGSIVFAVQIYVNSCTSVVAISNTTTIKGCVEAGDTYTSPNVTASEPNEPNAVLTMTATGVPLTAPNTGLFPSNSGTGSVSSHFSWTPDCNNIQLNPYFITIQATDASSPPDANYSSISVQVVSPRKQFYHFGCGR